MGSMPSLKVPVSECFSSSINILYTVGLNQYILCLFYDVDTDGSGAYRLRGCGQKSGCQFLFQFLNHGTEGGCVTRRIFGCVGKVAELVDGKDVFQLL